MSGIDRDALIDAAAEAMCPPWRPDQFRALAVAALDAMLPLIAEAVEAVAVEQRPDTQYREGLIDGYGRAARLIRRLTDGGDQ